jgi:predicted nuclease of predicted toxin-antitoxin system
MPLKFLTDENIAKSLIKALRENGYDVKDIKEEGLFGISDQEVIQKAKDDDRIIITHDKDFGNLLNFPLQSHKGVILVRYRDLSPHYVIPRLIPLLNNIKSKVKDSLTIVTEDLVKIHK